MVLALTAEASAGYDPYPYVSWPTFTPATAAIALLFAVPALAGPPAARRLA
jgi:hypothetical protein